MVKKFDFNCVGYYWTKDILSTRLKRRKRLNHSPPSRHACTWLIRMKYMNEKKWTNFEVFYGILSFLLRDQINEIKTQQIENCFFYF